MKKVFSIVFCMIIGQMTYAYPIVPHPLRLLISESPYIVYADVVAIAPLSDTIEWLDDKAILFVRDIYQGEVVKDTIEVHFSPNMICPAPARYKAGTSVLAFLYKDDSLDFYETYALSYGCKEINAPEEIAVYKTRIREMQDINRMQDSIARNSKIKDWLIACAVNPYTRWEGVYELSPGSDFMSYYDYNTDKTTVLQTLSESQIATLRQALLKTDSLSYQDMGLIDLVGTKNDTELLTFLIDRFKKTDGEYIWVRIEIMDRIAEISDRNDLKKIVKKINNVDYFDYKYEEKTTRLAKKFTDLL